MEKRIEIYKEKKISKENKQLSPRNLEMFCQMKGVCILAWTKFNSEYRELSTIEDLNGTIIKSITISVTL